MNIDTLSIARDLKAAELPASQAEAIAAAIGRAIGDGTAATSDIELVLQKIEALHSRIDFNMEALHSRIDLNTATLEAKIDAAEQRMTTKIEMVRSTLLTWIVGVIIATAGVIIAGVKL